MNYLADVLGINKILRPTDFAAKPQEVKPVLLVAEPLNAAAQELTQKMMTALQITHFKIVENPVEQQGGLILGEAVARKFNAEATAGQWLKWGGSEYLIIHAPEKMLSGPPHTITLAKRETWAWLQQFKSSLVNNG